MIFSQNDLNDFIHVTKQDDAYIILAPNQLAEFPGLNWSVVKEPYEISPEYTELQNAKMFCYAMLEALGVNTRYKHHGLRLKIEVEIEKENLEAN